jgi:hypothetical protein
MGRIAQPVALAEDLACCQEPCQVLPHIHPLHGKPSLLVCGCHLGFKSSVKLFLRARHASYHNGPPSVVRISIYSAQALSFHSARMRRRKLELTKRRMSI